LKEFKEGRLGGPSFKKEKQGRKVNIKRRIIISQEELINLPTRIFPKKE